MKSIDMRRLLGLILIGIGLLFGAIYLSGQLNPTARGVSTPQPNHGPLVPTSIGRAPTTTPVAEITITYTATPQAITITLMRSTVVVTQSVVATRPAEAMSTAHMVTPAPMSPAPIVPASYTLRQRVGVGVPLPDHDSTSLSELRPGWYLDWHTSESPGRPGGAEYAQMVRIPRGVIEPDLATIAQIAQKNPGALWLIGNEMDVLWQDNDTPEQYVAAYHDVYATVKQADPTSRIAIGGVSEPSPLRLQYLDRVLQTYRQRYGQDMPIDVWNVHNFILPERRGSWGVDIPPGIAASSGMDYQIDDHDNLAYFTQQLIDFRRWMAQHGYRDKELIVSEYGILMYADYGFDYARVRRYMLGSFDVMLNTADAELGLPADGNRLVQRWCWYSLSDTDYPTGNLADASTSALTPLGNDFKAYLDR